MIPVDIPILFFNQRDGYENCVLNKSSQWEKTFVKKHLFKKHYIENFVI